MHTVKIHDKRLVKESVYKGQTTHTEYVWAFSLYQKMGKEKGTTFWSTVVKGSSPTEYISLFITKPAPFNPDLPREEQEKKKQDFTLNIGEKLLGRFWMDYSGVANGTITIDGVKYSAILAFGYGFNVRIYVDSPIDINGTTYGDGSIEDENEDNDVKQRAQKTAREAKKVEDIEATVGMMMSDDDDEDIPF